MNQQPLPTNPEQGAPVTLSLEFKPLPATAGVFLIYANSAGISVKARGLDPNTLREILKTVSENIP